MLAARLDVVDAHDWYECRVQGLGWRFTAAIDLEVQRMSINPLQFPVVLVMFAVADYNTFRIACFFVV